MMLWKYRMKDEDDDELSGYENRFRFVSFGCWRSVLQISCFVLWVGNALAILSH